MSFSWRTGGKFSTVETKIAADLPADAEPLPTGISIDAGGSYQAFVTASIASSFTASVTTPQGGLLSLLDSEVSASFHLGMSAMVGGTYNTYLTAKQDESS